MSKIKNIIPKLKIIYSQWCRRRKLKHTDFTIISNNCWAGTAVYQPFGLKYNTPTVGMGFVDDDYIRFLENIDCYLSMTPEFINPKDAKYYEIKRKQYGREIDYPVACLGDVTLWFTHYKTADEALDKWERRKRRINRDRILVKYSQRYNRDSELLRRFLSLPFKNKIAFVEPDSPIAHPQVVRVPELTALNVNGGDETDYTLRYVDVLQLLNSMQ